MKQKNPVEVSNLSFEQALAEFESIVSSLETGRANLDEAMEIYTRGQKLKEHCAATLASAKLQVEKINAENGEAVSVSELES